MSDINSTKEKTVIVIPTHKTELSPLEHQSLKQVFSILKDYAIYIIKPQKTDISYLNDEYASLKFISFEDSFFDNFASFNSLMMEKNLYKNFLELGFSHMLVYHLDDYIFEDRLNYFINEGYDYIGAPALTRKLYQDFPFMQKLKYCKKKYNKSTIAWIQNDNEKIWNGGSLLRKLQNYYDDCIE